MSTDFDAPESLTDPGRHAYEIIVAYLKEHGFTNNSGCTAFYSPSDWAAREESYGTGSHLIIMYDGGAIRPVFSMDAAYDLDCALSAEGSKLPRPYALYEDMQEKLREAGFYFEECTGYYSAIYSLEAP